MKKGRLAVVSPWIIVGAVLILAPIFFLMTWQGLDRQQAYMTRLLVDRGDALIRSFEAGARTGAGFAWGHFQLQKLLMETAQQPGIDYLVVTDEKGLILADSDPSQIGENYGADLDLRRISETERLQWRRRPNAEGADTFEIYRQFKPARESEREFQARIRPDVAPIPPEWRGNNQPARMVIFVGLDMGPIESARQEEYHRAIMMAALFLIIGLSGIILLMLAQGYRSARTSLSRVQAFSDSLVQNMPMGLIAVDAAGHIAVFNQTAEFILHRSAAEVIGLEAESVLPEACLRMVRSLDRDRCIVLEEVDCLLGDGRIVPLETIAATLSEQDRITGIVLLFRDITEIRRLKKEIARNEHLASLGNLAAGVAHEIRNPLSSIKGFATYFRQRYRDNADDEKTAGIMIQEVDRLNRVISRLLEYARPTKGQRKEVPIQNILQHALHMIESQARERGVTVQTDLPADIPAVLIDPDGMKQVFLNLYLNALAAMEEGGVLFVSLVEQPNGRLRIEIRDTGIGIAPQDLGRVFDPYFTTKPSGTGLGLAIAQKILDAHDAEIQVKSVPGEGTTVTVRLPAKNQAREG